MTTNTQAYKHNYFSNAYVEEWSRSSQNRQNSVLKTIFKGYEGVFKLFENQTIEPASQTGKGKILREVKLIGQAALKGAVAGAVTGTYMFLTVTAVTAAIATISLGLVGLGATLLASKLLALYWMSCAVNGAVAGALGAVLNNLIGKQAGATEEERRAEDIPTGIVAGLPAAYLAGVLIKSSAAMSMGVGCIPVVAVAAFQAIRLATAKA